MLVDAGERAPEIILIATGSEVSSPFGWERYVGDWKRYARAYEACLGATSSCQAPGHVVPADTRSASAVSGDVTLITSHGRVFDTEQTAAGRDHQAGR